jgi:DNA-binding NarL/FixJ family response regulator
LVLKGELWVKRTLVHALIAALVARAENRPKGRFHEFDRRRLERLTHRQREVAESIATGASNKEIARRLNVTERTVKAHLTEMFRNVGVMDRLHLALLLNDVPGTRLETDPSPTGSPAPGEAVAGSQHRDHAEQSD